MDASSILLLTRGGRAKSALCDALSLNERNSIDVRSSAEALDLAKRGIGCALVVEPSASKDAVLADQIRAVRPDFVVLFAAAPESRNCLAPGGGADEMVGSSAAIARIRDYVRKVAATECNVLVTGETGCGKELVARALHRHSRRGTRTMTSINCAAIPDALFESELFGHERGAFTGAVSARVGKIEQADGGTVFLDEIEELSPMGQAKLLRAIELRQVERLGGTGARRVDIRIVAATNQDLAQLYECGRFRKDLYYRLAVVHIAVPPLRDRAEDIPALSTHFLVEMNQHFGLRLTGLEPEVIELLQSHNWPGNIRELRNLLEAVAVEKQAGPISRSDLPAWFKPGRHESSGGPSAERYRVLQALESTGWNKARAARELNWSRMTLYRKMARYELSGGAHRKPVAGSDSDRHQSAIA
jgi:transcriptional regulator with PAS, ATPase and Fis domain